LRLGIIICGGGATMCHSRELYSPPKVRVPPTYVYPVRGVISPTKVRCQRDGTDSELQALNALIDKAYVKWMKQPRRGLD
jgi:hypothetical protein